MGSEVRLTESELRPQLHGSRGPRSLASGFQLVCLLVKGNLPVRAIGWIKGGGLREIRTWASLPRSEASTSDNRETRVSFLRDEH